MDQFGLSCVQYSNSLIPWLYNSPRLFENLPEKNMEWAMQQFWIRLNLYPYFTPAKLIRPGVYLWSWTLSHSMRLTTDNTWWNLTMQISNARSSPKEPWRVWRSETYDYKNVGEFVIAVLRMNTKRNIFTKWDHWLWRHRLDLSSWSLPGSVVYSYICRVQELSSSIHKSKLVISTPLPSTFFQDKRSGEAKGRKDSSV